MKAASADSSCYSDSNVKYADWVPGLINAWDCMQAGEREDTKSGGAECAKDMYRGKIRQKIVYLTCLCATM